MKKLTYINLARLICIVTLVLTTDSIAQENYSSYLIPEAELSFKLPSGSWVVNDSKNQNKKRYHFNSSNLKIKVVVERTEKKADIGIAYIGLTSSLAVLDILYEIGKVSKSIASIMDDSVVVMYDHLNNTFVELFCSKDNHLFEILIQVSPDSGETELVQLNNFLNSFKKI